MIVKFYLFRKSYEFFLFSFED